MILGIHFMPSVVVGLNVRNTSLAYAFVVADSIIWAYVNAVSLYRPGLILHLL